jgi:formate hydrogenlyase transcriptional activator
MTLHSRPSPATNPTPRGSTARESPSSSSAGTAERYRTLLEINNAIISNLTREALFDAVARALGHVVPFDRTAVFLHDPARDVLRLFVLQSTLPSAYFVPGLEMPAADSHVGRVFREQRPLSRRDLAVEREYPMEDRALADGVRSYIVAPLVARGRSLGALAVASTRPDRYAEADVTFLQEVANQVALAIENMRAYEDLTALGARVEAAAERFRTLLEINNAIITHLTKEALLDAIFRSIQGVIPCDRLGFTLHEPDADVLRIAAVAGVPGDYFVVGRALDRRDSHMGWVFEHRKPLLRRDLRVEREFATEERLLAEGVHSLCGAPLMVHGRCIGTFHVSSVTPDRYTEADRDFLQEVANQVALAVENMQAYGEIATLQARLERENVYLRDEIRREHNFDEIVGTSPALLEVLRKVEQVAPTGATVLVLGETGTGKELIVRALHDLSTRRHRPLVKVNCGAIAAGLVESELFGHVKGAFTGALERRVGRFELADGGTLFLDEVGELPPETQVKLLRVLQEQEFEPVGSSQSVRVDVRIIAATARNLEDAVASGRFRADLFYRLNVLPLTVPPLRERRADVPQLVMFFLERFGKKLGKPIQGVSRETMDLLVQYPWPGNIRELQNVIERGVVLCQGPLLALGRDLLPRGLVTAPGPPARDPGPGPGTGGAPRPAVAPASEPLPLEEVERRHILAVLGETRGVIEGPRGAARLLALHPNTLRSRMKRLGIPRLAPPRDATGAATPRTRESPAGGAPRHDMS